MKRIIIFGILIIGSPGAFAQYTQVPDPNFEQALIDLGIDSEGNLDGQFLTADALGIENLIVPERNINAITGIEAFADLRWLNLYGNNIATVDLSMVAQSVYYLNISNNQLTEIDLSPLPGLVNIYVHTNNIKHIDASNFLSGFVLSAANNPLTSINVDNSHFQVLKIQYTLLTTIDLQNLPYLRDLDIFYSSIKALDFSGNPLLEEVYAFESPLASIYLPNNPNLELLRIEDTQLTTLDVTQCPALMDVIASNCQLTSIQMHPNLEFLYIPHNQFSTLTLSNNTHLQNVDIFSNTNLTSLDCSGAPQLKYISASYNENLTSINLNGASALQDISLVETSLAEVNFSNNPSLFRANLNDNMLLQRINVKNGNNEGIDYLAANTNTPRLHCVIVDNPLAPNNNILVQPEVTLVGSEAECVLGNTDFTKMEVFLYPNPAQDILYIASREVFVKIVFYDILGRKLLEETENFNKISLTNLPSGLLFVLMVTEKGSITQKVVKE